MGTATDDRTGLTAARAIHRTEEYHEQDTRYTQDEQGIVTLTIDVPGRSMNVLTPAFDGRADQAIDGHRRRDDAARAR